jgi:hypothetical protein
MGGIAGASVSVLNARFIVASVVIASCLVWESIVGEQAPRNDSIPQKSKHHLPVVPHLFFIAVALSLLNDNHEWAGLL